MRKIAPVLPCWPRIKLHTRAEEKNLQNPFIRRERGGEDKEMGDKKGTGLILSICKHCIKQMNIKTYT